MKIAIYLLPFLLFSCNQPRPSSTLPVAEKDTVSKQEEANPVVLPAQLNSTSAIQSEYAAIVNAIEEGNVDSVSFKYNCDNEKGGTVTCFSEKGKVRMLRHSYHEYDHYEATDQYFVKDSTLFFVFSKALSWSFDSNAPETGGTKDHITERRTYIIDQQAVKCLEKKYVTFSYNKSNPQPDKIANKEVKCTSLKPVQEKYEALLHYVREGGKGCPVD